MKLHDPSLLFQWILVMSKSFPVFMKYVKKYKLWSYPPSIFESPGVMQELKMSRTTEEILKLSSKSVNSESPETVVEQLIGHYVLDGRSLLHRIQWFQNLLYIKIIKNYCGFVIKNYGSAIVALMAISQNYLIKTLLSTDLKENWKNFRKKSLFLEKTIYRATKQQFLSNPLNKEKKHLEQNTNLFM